MFTEDFSKGFTHAILVQASLVNINEAVKELQEFTTSTAGHGLLDDIENELQGLFRRVGLDENGLS